MIKVKRLKEMGGVFKFGEKFSLSSFYFSGHKLIWSLEFLKI
jgi:hypothetical protein